MASSSPPKLLIVLSEPTDAAPIAVRLDSFLRFSEEVTFALEDMVHRWQHCAAPAARLGTLQRRAQWNPPLD